jgi:type IV secretory pathway TrbF-like protein
LRLHFVTFRGIYDAFRIRPQWKKTMGDTLRPRTDGTRDPFHAQAEAFGLSRTNMLCWRFAALVLAGVVVGETAALVYTSMIDKPPVETVFVLVDEETRVLATVQARTWTFDQQAKADVAREWLLHMRNRGLDNYQTAILRGRARRLTAQGAVEKADVMLREIDDKLKHGPDGSEQGIGLAVREGIETAPVGSDEETGDTVVRVDWQERTYDKSGRTGPWNHMYVYVHVRPIEPTKTAQVMANGHGLYVVDFTAIGQGRPKPADLAAAQ